jgi:DNA-binding transcriptional regulator GbsR (MarR family)
MSKNGRTSVNDEEQTGPLSTSTTEGNIEHYHALILNSKKVTISEVANQLQISRGSASKIIHHRPPGLRKMSNTLWLAKFLMS